jgi:glucose/arabinose dehydrogenase
MNASLDRWLRKCRLHAAIVFSMMAIATGAQAQSEFDWRSDWELADGLTMEIDSQGYSFPTQTAFVPSPGTHADDPLYFVVELKGNIKVVTNDRTVHEFAVDILPNSQGESFVQAGAAGICLDPVKGYVFATFAYLDDTHTYRNGIVRFATKPEQFGLRAEEPRYFLDLFEHELSATAHQIGPCQVKDGMLYVTVGYGADRSQSRGLHSTLGSIIRMTVDFEPPDDNPYYTNDGQDTAIDYIWAYGMRNPFGLRFVGDRLFATENGGNIDRFNEIEKGEDYLWDGTDWGIGARAVQVFAPSNGIVHLDFVPDDNTLFPDQFRGRFVTATAGSPGRDGPGKKGARSILLLAYDFDERRMAEPPETLLRFRGKNNPYPVSVSLGPDGLYFTALLPNQAGLSAVYRINFDTDAKYPHRIGEDKAPLALVARYQCRQCHEIDGQGGAAGPPFDATLMPRLTTRLNDPTYEQAIDKVDQIENEPYLQYRDARHAIMAATGESRTELWLNTYLREPRFDNPEVEMPNLEITKAHAKILAAYLIESTTVKPQQLSQFDWLRFAVAKQIPDLRYRHLVFSFAFGALAATFSLLVLYFYLRRRRR